ncbi:hypothetical protein [Nocardiopsis metallicus]|uniref:Uncharacterized protein n=1 Tax=Nocardiopsis metallicus TaxID=179819 RepID=A0A840WNB7_9ACTN|nr:hypothetical protein [Nocardiopsis metallicus]MBB5493117.1 hypothetical protein [Nocardiopsis metallicus]
MEFLASLDSLTFRIVAMSITAALGAFGVVMKIAESDLNKEKARLEYDHENSQVSHDARRIGHEKDVLEARKKEADIALNERAEVAKDALGVKNATLVSLGPVENALKLMQKISPKIEKSINEKSKERKEGGR